MSQLQNKTLGADATTREASKLRTLAVGTLSKSEYFKSIWIPDEEETPDERAGQEEAPTNSQSYCILAAKKAYYADGFLLQPLAIKLAQDILVWKYQGKS